MSRKCFAIVAAEEQELAGLKEFLKEADYLEGAAGCVFLTGFVGDCKVVAMRCGIGKVNAAIGTQVLIDAFHPDALVNIGSAGGLAEGMKLYDIVVSTQTVQHDMDVTALGYAPGVVPGNTVPYIEADPGLQEDAAEAGRAEGLTIWQGCVASGDKFMTDVAHSQWVADTFGALCTEMEGAAVAQVCQRNHLPFVIIRAISDTADHKADISYNEFSAKASLQAVSLIKRMLNGWVH